MQTGCYRGTAELNNLSRSRNWCHEPALCPTDQSPPPTTLHKDACASLSHLGPPARLLLVPLALAEQTSAEKELSHCTCDSKGTSALLCFEARGLRGMGPAGCLLCSAEQSGKAQTLGCQHAIFLHEVVGLFPFPSPSIFIASSSSPRPEREKRENTRANFAPFRNPSGCSELSFLWIRTGPRLKSHLPPPCLLPARWSPSHMWRGAGGEISPRCCPHAGTAWFPGLENPITTLSGFCPGKHTQTPPLFQTPSPALPIHPGDILAAWPGSCQHSKPSWLRTRAFQALSLVPPLERSVLLSQVHVTEGSKTTYSCRNKQKFS